MAGNTLLLWRLDIRLQTLQITSSSATVLPQRRNRRVKAEQELLILACLCGFRLGIILGLVRNTTDFFLESDDSVVEDGSGGCFDGRRGGRPQGGVAAGTTGQSEITGLSRSKETASILVPICRRKNLLRRSITR